MSGETGHFRDNLPDSKLVPKEATASQAHLLRHF